MANFLPLVVSPHVAGPFEQLQSGDNLIVIDSQKILFGTGADSSVYYDGTNMVIDSQEVGSGVLSINPNGGGIWAGIDSAATFWGTGHDASITYDGTNMVINPAVVGSGVVTVSSGLYATNFRHQESRVNDNGSGMVIGEAVYINDADGVDKARADSSSTAAVFGLVADTSIASTSSGNIITSGKLTATTGQWDAVTGGSGGLTPGATYYLDEITAGAITEVAPTSPETIAVIIGEAMSTTEMLVRISRSSATPTVQLTADADIYVDPAGSDTTGDGSSGAPYATIFRAMEHVNTLIPGTHLITINLSADTHTITQTINFTYPYSSNLEWVGDVEDVSSPTISSISGTATTGSSPYTGLEYIEFSLDLAAATPDPIAGEFVYLEGCTGGTNPNGLNGLSEIMSVTSGVATCRLWRRVGTTELPSGAITVSSAKLIRTVFSFTADDHGIFVSGPFDMGHWSGVVFKGNDTAVGSSKRGIRLFTGAGIRAASQTPNVDGLHVYQWNTGYEIIGSGASAYILEGSVAKCTARGFRIDNGASVRFTGGVVSGCGTIAVNVSSGADAEFSTTYFHSCQQVGVVDRGSLSVASCPIDFDQGAQTALQATNNGFIRADGATITGYTTDYDPPADTQDQGCWISVSTDWGFGTNGTQRSTVNSSGLVAAGSTFQPNHTVAGYGSGTNYTVTNSSAEVDEGTDSAITLDQAGTYVISGGASLRYSGATFGSSEVITFKLRRTNNTAADLTNSAVALVAFQLTTFSGSMSICVNTVEYTTSNTDDRIALFIDVSSGPSAGSLLVTDSYIFAERIG